MVGSNKKILLIILFLFIFLGCFYYLQKLSNSDKKNSLRVYAYSSFARKSGPGQELATLFKDKTGVDVEFVSSDSSLIMLTKFNQDKKEVDLFIGIDQFSKKSSLKNIDWQENKFNFDKTFYNLFDTVHKNLVPYNWSPMTFIYRKGEVQPPKSWENLSNPNYKITVPDPRTSSPGNIYLYWIHRTFKDKFSLANNRLKASIKHWAPSWTSSYALFVNGTANMGFSYLSSVAYHWGQGQNQYQPVSFKEGHPVHIEYTGVPQKCKNCSAAHKFIELMLSPEGQKIIMTKNVMLPVRSTVAKGTIYEKLPMLNLLSTSDVDEYNGLREGLIKQWKSVHRDN